MNVAMTVLDLLSDPWILAAVAIGPWWPECFTPRGPLRSSANGSPRRSRGHRHCKRRLERHYQGAGLRRLRRGPWRRHGLPQGRMGPRRGMAGNQMVRLQAKLPGRLELLHVGFARLFVAASTGLQSIWSSFITWFLDKWDAASGAVAHGLIWTQNKLGLLSDADAAAQHASVDQGPRDADQSPRRGRPQEARAAWAGIRRAVSRPSTGMRRSMREQEARRGARSGASKRIEAERDAAMADWQKVLAERKKKAEEQEAERKCRVRRDRRSARAAITAGAFSGIGVVGARHGRPSPTRLPTTPPTGIGSWMRIHEAIERTLPNSFSVDNAWPTNFSIRRPCGSPGFPAAVSLSTKTSARFGRARLVSRSGCCCPYGLSTSLRRCLDGENFEIEAKGRDWLRYALPMIDA